MRRLKARAARYIVSRTEVTDSVYSDLDATIWLDRVRVSDTVQKILRALRVPVRHTGHRVSAQPGPQRAPRTVLR